MKQGTRILHASYGEGIVSKISLSLVEVYFSQGGRREFSRTNFTAEVIDDEEAGSNTAGISPEDVRFMLEEVLDKYNAVSRHIQMGTKWTGGVMTLQPSNPDLKPKEIPIESFFHKIVMMRDRLRVLEQNINAHPQLNDEEKVNLQQYITRIYGSFTTFNLLFEDKEDYFSGEKTK
ncbi:MAG: hypothetical protein Q7J34_09730 [Bacteroidales bacterium]|nr:hypothetical protein [Bacteroidales bacterium]